jgi:hypothetical protein
MFKKDVFSFMLKSVVFTALSIFISTNSFSQTEEENKNFIAISDSIVKANDTLRHSPKKAALMSAIIPGLGQAYNKKYWKIPIIYAGLAGLSYAVIENNKMHKELRAEYISRLKNDTVLNFEGLSIDNLAVYKETYRKNRDLLIIGALGFYILNIVDASVDAHLFTFDVSDDLSFKLRPTLLQGMTGSNIPGISLKIKL